MPRYIDRDTALSHPFANGQYDKENANEHFIFGFEGYKEWLEQLPTVDAVPVVRCKECKWCHAGYCEKADDIIPFGFAHCEWENFYCAWGERKEDAE